MAAAYDAGRAVPLDALEGWRIALAEYMPPVSQRPVVDLGCGTGLWEAAFARWFDGYTIGLEPAQAMLAQAVARSPERCAFARARAEALPLRSSSCGAAWLSTVVHHIDDLDAAAREVRRVLVDDAPVLIRNAFPGHNDEVTLFRYFPAAAAVAETFVGFEETLGAFARAGFALERHERISQRTASSLAEYAERVEKRGDTTLMSISDDDFGAGLAALEADVARETEPEPIHDAIDFLVLR